ncbi:uncharacterized protein HD556DRAFT_860599 [Suillus plorans]|uniref:F-box domain-containing protein n=1 Tax=Suillus plorans TaxID=116603 RepID=A0A9P7AHK9_9AGAM|nr:uncharacterized protein HD556DRAFT_860599 [Suillus plorans]KAG1788487.1 hypothetical protein HD556DRAFT_860599 [Suillus plorans]
MIYQKLKFCSSPSSRVWGGGGFVISYEPNNVTLSLLVTIHQRLANDMQTVNWNPNLSAVSDIISAIQNMLHSQTTMLDLDTPYSRAALFNPNQCAIELEDQSINERNHQLDTVLHEISDLETIMNGIQNLHQQLVEKKNKIIESINSHKRLKLALWRLPTEILSYIFVYCLPEDRYLSPASRRAPILLTRICRRWREVAVGVPSLWCRLRVAVEHNDWQKRAFCYDTWLKRTLGHPLSLALCCWTPLVRSLLQPYIHQIYSLDIDFQRLRRPECVFKDFSALQELTILNHITFKLLSSFAPLWAHLTKVEISIDKQDAFLHLLRLCPNLSSLTSHVDFLQKKSLKPFTHPKLESLRLYGEPWTSGEPLRGMFDALSLPNLRALHVWNTSIWPHEEFKTFLTRSACPLESLVFRGIVITVEQRVEYVALVPFLKVVVRNPHRKYSSYI